MREQRMQAVAAAIETMIHNHSNNRDRDRFHITYDSPTPESISSYSAWNREYHHIMSGREYFIISETVPGGTPHILYVVNVSMDSELTAASELMDLIARKF